MFSEPWLVACVWLSQGDTESRLGSLTFSQVLTFLSGSLSMYLCVRQLLPHLNTAPVAISFTKKRKLIIEINTRKAKETSKRIRGMTGEEITEM